MSDEPVSNDEAATHLSDWLGGREVPGQKIKASVERAVEVLRETPSGPFSVIPTPEPENASPPPDWLQPYKYQFDPDTQKVKYLVRHNGQWIDSGWSE